MLVLLVHLRRDIDLTVTVNIDLEILQLHILKDQVASLGSRLSCSLGAACTSRPRVENILQEVLKVPYLGALR